MLFLRSSKGYQNTFSINVYMNQFGSTINAPNWSSNTQYLRTSGINQSLNNNAYYINFINQNTQEEHFEILGENIVQTSSFPRTKQFFIFCDGAKLQSGQPVDNHIELEDGLYNFEVYWGISGASSKNSNAIVAMVYSGMALVHNDNYVNNHYQNSINGVEIAIRKGLD